MTWPARRADRCAAARDAAEHGGLPCARVPVRSTTAAAGDAVRPDEDEARAPDITAVPFYVVGRTYGIPGATPPFGYRLRRCVLHAMVGP